MMNDSGIGKENFIVVRRKNQGPAIVYQSISKSINKPDDVGQHRMMVLLGEQAISDKMIAESLLVKPANEEDIIEQISFFSGDDNEQKKMAINLVTNNNVVDLEVSYLTEGIYCQPVYNFFILDEENVAIHGNFYLVSETSLSLSEAAVYYIESMQEETRSSLYKISDKLSLYKGEILYPFVNVSPCRYSREFYFSSLSGMTYLMISIENTIDNNLGIDLPGGFCYIYQRREDNSDVSTFLLDKVSLVPWVENSDFKIVTHVKSDDVTIRNISLDVSSYRLEMKNNTNDNVNILFDIYVAPGNNIMLNYEDINVMNRSRDSRQFMVQLSPREESNIDYYVVPEG